MGFLQVGQAGSLALFIDHMRSALRASRQQLFQNLFETKIKYHAP
jgi:hypothetical protein